MFVCFISYIKVHVYNWQIIHFHVDLYFLVCFGLIVSHMTGIFMFIIIEIDNIQFWDNYYESTCLAIPLPEVMRGRRPRDVFKANLFPQSYKRDNCPPASRLSMHKNRTALKKPSRWHLYRQFSPPLPLCPRRALLPCSALPPDARGVALIFFFSLPSSLSLFLLLFLSSFFFSSLYSFSPFLLLFFSLYSFSLFLLCHVLQK